jgi:uncharacterized protein (TIGR00255 family)
MTGYAQSTLKVSNLLINLELKSVNHRFLDISYRTNDEFKSLESQIRDILAQKLQRGKIELKIYLKEDPATSSTANICLNSSKLNAYLSLIEQIKTVAPTLDNSSTCDVLLLPGVIDTPENLAIEELHPLLLSEINNLCDKLKQNQQSEGEKLAKVILDKVTAIEEAITNARELLLAVTASYKLKLKQRLVDAIASIEIDEQRFTQEFAYFCQKIDVAEELDRLSLHTQQLRKLINSSGSVGKKADFITQEMLREANTFGSKSVSLNTSQQAIELKVLIEQIKEQIQNIL